MFPFSELEVLISALYYLAGEASHVFSENIQGTTAPSHVVYQRYAWICWQMLARYKNRD